MEQVSEQNHNLWRGRRTLCQLLNDRLYIVSDADLTMTKEAFEAKFPVDGQGRVPRENLQMLVAHKNDPTDTLMAFFPDNKDKKSIGKADINRYLLRMKQEGVHRAILVVQQKPSSVAAKTLQECRDEYVVEIFLDNELLVNITHHILVPKHVLLTDEQKAALLARYKLQETQLPRILETDAVARYFGLRKGQVVKIIRPSETAGRYVTYRLCS